MPPIQRSASIVSVASAFPDTMFSQKDMQVILGVKNPVVDRLLAAPHIQKRHLLLGTNMSPPNSPHSTDSTDANIVPLPRLQPESNAALHARHMEGLRTIGVNAARHALTAAGVVDLSSVGIVVAVTSTGLAMPGFSAILMDQLGLSPSTLRLDVVGMGCNAGMSGLRTLSMMLAGCVNGTVGLLVCCEVCSAMYVNDDTTATGIVNSLFGDGAVATVLRSGLPNAIAPSSHPLRVNGGKDNNAWTGIALIDFESTTLTEYGEDMRYVVSEAHDRMCFRLSKRIPYVVGDNVASPVTALLARKGLAVKDVKEWVVHTGGAAVLEGVVRNLGLCPSALRHTSSVLRDYGNISSGSFLVSLERLILEQRTLELSHAQTSSIVQGDWVVFIAMGPGATIEVGLGQAA